MMADANVAAGRDIANTTVFASNRVEIRFWSVISVWDDVGKCR